MTLSTHPARHGQQLEKFASTSWPKSVAGLGHAVTENLLAAATLSYLGYKAGALGGDMLEGNARRTIMNP